MTAFADTPDVLVLGHAPPENDAFAVLSALRAAQPDREPPPAVVIARAPMPRTAATRALGVREILPVATTTPEDLDCAIALALDAATLRRRLERSQAEAQSAARALDDADRRFAGFMDALTGGAWIKDLEGRYLYANKGFCLAFATSAEAMIGRRAADIMPPDQAAANDDNSRRALASADRVLAIETVTVPNGPARRMLVSDFVLRDADGRPQALGGIAIDVTLGLWKFIDKSPFGVAMFDAALELVAAGETFWRTLGAQAPGGAGAKARSIACAAPIDWDRIEAECLAGKTIPPTELRFDAPGEPRWLRWSAYPWTHHDRTVRGVLVNVEDITEARRSELERRAIAERYRSLFENAAFGAAEFTADGARVIRVNKKFCAIGGYDPEDLIGRLVTDFIPPDEFARFVACRTAFLQGDANAFTGGTRILCKDGGVRSLRVSPRLVRDGQGAALYTTAIVEDITEQLKADAALRASEERFRVFFNNAAFGAVEVALDGRILRANKALRAIGGWDDEDLNGRRAIDLLHPECREAYFAARRDFFNGVSEKINGVWRFLRKDGSVAFLRLALSLMRGRDGAALYTFGAVVDVTEQIRAEQALRASEARYRAFFDNGAFGAFEGDLAARFINVNQFFADLGGYARADMIGRPVADFLHADDLAEHRRSRDAFSRGESDAIVKKRRFRRSDGEYVLVKFRPVLLRDAEGAPDYICGIAEDLTEETRAAEALARSEARLRAVLDGAQDGVLSVDQTGIIQSANMAANAMFGYARDELVGMPISALCAERASAGPDQHIDQAAVADGRPRISEGLRKDGSTFAFEMRKFRGQIDNEPLYVDFLRDLTERRLLEAEMAQLKEQRLAAMGGMAGALAHELNQPLAAIALHVETARRLARLSPEDRPFTLEATLDQAVAQALRASEIILHLRRFAARGEPDKTVQHLHALLREVCLTPPKGSGRIALHLDAALDQVFVDSVQIRLVFQNLIRNAFEAMATAPDPVLAISTRNENAKAILVDFADRGPGVSSDAANRLFEPLASGKPAGMGIGLSLSRAIASIHSGALTLSSSTAQGATFTLKLPVHSMADR